MWQLIASFGIFLFALPYAYTRFGYMSAQFLIILHLFLGIPIRTMLMFDAKGSDQYILPVLYIDDSILTSCFLLSISTLLFLYLATITTRSTQAWISNEANYSSTRDLSWYRVFILAALVLMTYLVLLYVFFGGISNAFESLLTRTISALQGYSYVTVLADIFFVAAVSTFYLWKSKNVKKAKTAALILVPSSLILLSLSGGRGNLIQAFITLAILSSNGNKFLHKKTGLSAIALILFTASVIPVGLAARKAAQLGTDFSDELPSIYAEIGPSLSAPFALIDHFELSREYAEIHGYDLGKQFLEFAIKPIPRSLWPAKPQPIAIKIREEFYGDTLGGIPPGLAGELFISFGWISIIFFPIFLIASIRLLGRLCKNPKFRTHRALLASLITPYIAFNLLRGGFDIGGMRILLIIASAYFVIKLGSKPISK